MQAKKINQSPSAISEYEAEINNMRQKLDALMQRAVFVRGVGELSGNIHGGMLAISSA